MGRKRLAAKLQSVFHSLCSPEPDLRDVFLGWRQTIRRQRLERDRLVLTAEARVLYDQVCAKRDAVCECVSYVCSVSCICVYSMLGVRTKFFLRRFMPSPTNIRPSFFLLPYLFLFARPRPTPLSRSQDVDNALADARLERRRRAKTEAQFSVLVGEIQSGRAASDALRARIAELETALAAARAEKEVGVPA